MALGWGTSVGMVNFPVVMVNRREEVREHVLRREKRE